MNLHPKTTAMALWIRIGADSECDGSCSSYCESDIQFSDEEPESAVCGNNYSQTNESPDKDPYVYPGSQLKLSESVLLILTLAITHNLNGSCLCDMISLINLHCIPRPQNKCVRSLNALKKCFVDLQLPITKHFYCKFCSEYLGVTGDTPDVCSICGKDVSQLIHLQNKTVRIMNDTSLRDPITPYYSRTCI